MQHASLDCLNKENVMWIWRTIKILDLISFNHAKQEQRLNFLIKWHWLNFIPIIEFDWSCLIESISIWLLNKNRRRRWRTLSFNFRLIDLIIKHKRKQSFPTNRISVLSIGRATVWQHNKNDWEHVRGSKKQLKYFEWVGTVK